MFTSVFTRTTVDLRALICTLVSVVCVVFNSCRRFPRGHYIACGPEGSCLPRAFLFEPLWGAARRRDDPYQRAVVIPAVLGVSPWPVFLSNSSPAVFWALRMGRLAVGTTPPGHTFPPWF